MTTVHNNTDKNNKASVDAKSKNPPLKKPHCISNTTFVVIDEKLVKRLRINEDNTWLEQVQTENDDGILMKIRRLSSVNNEES
jgi:hypothetical protein